MFEALKDILVLKADSDELKELVKSMPASFFEKYIDILEKARSRHKGLQANFPVRDFGMEMDPELEPEMIRDALGHHVSHYKAAFHKGNHVLANKHAKQAMVLMNLADILQDHSHGKLKFDHVPTHPWERNKYTNRYDENHEKVKTGKAKVGDWVTNVKGLSYSKAGSDYSFLQSNPHESYASETGRHGHQGAYPWEHIKVNDKHIHIEDVPAQRDYVPHPFDTHPIIEHFDESAKNRTSAADQAYISARDDWHDKLPHVHAYFDRVEGRKGDAHLGHKPAASVYAAPAAPAAPSEPEKK